MAQRSSSKDARRASSKDALALASTRSCSKESLVSAESSEPDGNGRMARKMTSKQIERARRRLGVESPHRGGSGGGEAGSMRPFFRKLVESTSFGFVISVLIVANAILIGWELGNELAQEASPIPFTALEYGFLGVYTIELLIRFYAYGWRQLVVWSRSDDLAQPGDGFRLSPSEGIVAIMIPRALADPWVMFDAVLVISGFVSANTAADSVTFSPSALRLARVLRVLRAVRSVAHWQVLAHLARGLLSSTFTMLSVVILTGLTSYFFALLILEYVSKPVMIGADHGLSEKYVGIVLQHFPDLQATMVTLISFMTLDNAVSIYYPLMLERPVTAIIFLSFLLLVSIALMNLVTAVIVERAIQSGSDERKLRVKKEGARRAKQCESLGFLFQEMDASGDGELQREELLNAPAIIRDRLGEVLGMGAHISEEMIPQYQEAIAQLFSVLDVDGSESLGIDEFMSGLLRVVEGSTTADRHMLVRIDKMCENIAGACGVGSKLGDAASSRAAREKKLQAVRMLFQELDTDGDGVLSREELEVAIDPKSGAYALMRELCHPHDVADLDLGSLFEQLDTDRTGYVSLDEFYFAFRHLADFSAVKDRHLLVRIEKLVTNLASHHGLAAQHIGRERRPPSELSTDASLADAGILRWCSPSVSKAEHISVDLPPPRLAPMPSGANTQVELRQLAATVAKLAEDQGAAMAELAANQRRLSEQVEELARRMPKNDPWV